MLHSAIETQKTSCRLLARSRIYAGDEAGLLSGSWMMSSDAHASRLGRADSENGPRNNAEHQIYGIWADVLGRSDFGIFDSFFDLGGNSVDAIRALNAIERDFGRTLSLGCFFRSPTIAASYMLLRVPAAASSWKSLVPIRAEGRKPPLFCVHPLGGSTMRFFELARALPADQPVYGLQSPGLVDPDWAPHSMRDIAQICFDEIRQLSAALPIQLIGYSFGGILAFEIAQMVTRSTGQCPLVAMIDTPTAGVGGGGDKAADERSAIEYLAATAHLDPSEVSAISDREAAVRQMYGQAVRNVITEPDLPLTKWRSLLNILDTNLAVLRSYKLQPYQGDVIVFSNEKDKSKSDLGWSSYARQVITYPLGAAHDLALEGEGVRPVAPPPAPCLPE